MGLADGDLFVSGSILSFQQANRLYQHFRAAAVPSNLQAGALWSGSGDDRLWHQGASDLLEVFTEKTGAAWENHIPNSGLGVWSHSTLAQEATGAQSDFEIGSAIYEETGEVADDSGNWTKTDCTMALTNDAGNGAGGSDNYYTITEAAATQRITQSLSGLTVGKIYKLSVFILNGTGTWASATLNIMDNGLANTIESTTLATEAAWADYSVIFEATETNNQMVLDLALGGGETAKIDNIKVIEVGPGCVASDDKGPDWWTKTATLDLLRIQANATYFKGLYGIKVTKGAAGAEYLNAFGRVYNTEAHYAKYRGKTVAFGCWVYSVSAADNVKLEINDSDGTTASSFVAADALTWVEITRTCGATITSFTARILFDGDSADVAYVSHPILIYGSSIGEGNYRPKQQEMIWLENNIASKRYNGLVDQDDFTADLVIEADTNAKLPKGAKLIAVLTSVLDSGSAAAADVHLQLRKDATADFFYVNSVAGRTNDMHAHKSGVQPCDENGDVDIHIDSSGADTFDIEQFEYHGVQVN